MVNKLKALYRTDFQTIQLLLEAFLFLGWARILKALPFSKVAPTLGIQLQETTYNADIVHIATLRKISHAIHIMSRYTCWESMCLVKAIAGMKMLDRRQLESTLYLGTSKDENGQMIAHAWLRSGPIYISGSEEMERFTVVGKFAKFSNEAVRG